MKKIISEMKALEAKIKEMAKEVNIDLERLSFRNRRRTIDKQKQNIIEFKSSRSPEVVEENKYNSPPTEDAYIASGYVQENGNIFCSIEKLIQHPVRNKMTIPATYYINYKDGNITVKKI